MHISGYGTGSIAVLNSCTIMFLQQVIQRKMHKIVDTEREEIYNIYKTGSNTTRKKKEEL